MEPLEEETPSSAKAIVPVHGNKRGGGPGGGSAPRSAAASSSPAEAPRNIGAYAMQCAECFKFRLIPTQEEYEDIRQNFIEDPFVCSKKPNASCDDPADIECDSTVLLVADKPNIPKTPAGCKRVLIMRKDFSKLDALYIMPNGRRVRSPRDVEQFLEANPKHKGQFSVPDFNFAVPKIMEEKLRGKSKESGSASTSKRMKN
uniref:Methyl-CpG-binding domain-containing protein 4 n=1 Tax=Anthurium amnicola TaxID=1678845 RepID=A0A1D1YPG1_9ARAE